MNNVNNFNQCSEFHKSCTTNFIQRLLRQIVFSLKVYSYIHVLTFLCFKLKKFKKK